MELVEKPQVPFKHLYIACPTFTGQPRIETFHCLLNIQRGCDRLGWKITWKFTVGDSMIFRTRNLFVGDFLRHTDCTDLVMIDDDLWWEDDAVLRLVSHPVDLVAGAYPKRQDKLEFTFKSLGPDEYPDARGLMEVKYAPTGFMKISRHCLQTMVDAYPELEYSENLLPCGRSHALFWFSLLDTDEGRQLHGEDFTFCHRWRALGGKVFIDTLLDFKHFGKTSWRGRFADHIPGYLESLTQSSAA